MSHGISTRLTWMDNGNVIRVYTPDTDQINLALKTISPGSLFVSSGNQWVSELVGIFTALRHPIWLYRNGFSSMYSHCGTYLGDNKHRTVEAFPRGVVEESFFRFIDCERTVKVWKNNNMSVEKLQDLKGTLESMVGPRYDWKAMLGFIFPIKADPAAYICTEATIIAYKKIGMFPTSFKATAVDPTEIRNFLTSIEGLNMGWRHCLNWE